MKSGVAEGRRQKCWYLNARDVLALTGLSRSTIDRLENQGKFPKRVELSTQRVGWIVEEVEAWRKQREGQRKRKKIAQWEALRKSTKQHLSPEC